MSSSDKVTLSFYEACLLYTIPKPGGDLRTILRYYISVNRAACPTFEEISQVLGNAYRLGIISKSSHGYIIEDEWYSRIHAYDDSAENEIESMLRFEEEVRDLEFDVEVSPAILLTQEEYETAALGLAID